MVRMKLTDDDFNVKELDVPYEGERVARYAGEVPKTGTILRIRVTKMWWTTTDDGTSATRLIAVAEDNNGKLAEYNGLDTWEYLTWKPSANFRYQPFLETFGLTLMDIKTKMQVERNDDNIGTPIISIGDWEVGSDDAVARIVIKKDWWAEGQEFRSKVDRDGWLPLEDEDEEPEEEEERPTRASRGRTSQGKASSRTRQPARQGSSSRRRGDPDEDEDEDDEYDDDVEDDEEDEEVDDEYDEEEEAEEEEARPARTKGRTSRGARVAEARPAARTRSTRSGSSGTRAPAASGSRRTSSRGSNRANAAAARDKRSGGSQDEPPF